MKNYFIFCFIVCSLGHFNLAKAETNKTNEACQMIDRIYGTFSILREIEHNTSHKSYLENMAGLDMLIQQINLSEIVPKKSRDGLSKDGKSHDGKSQDGQYNNGLAAENQVLVEYMASLRKASARNQNESSNTARKIIDNALSVDFTRSLQSLEHYWNCRPLEPSPPSRAENMTEKPLYLGASKADVKSAPVGVSKPFEETTPTQSRAASTRFTKQVKFALPAQSTRTSILLELLALLSLIGIFYFAKKRAKVFKVRKKRRFINKPAHIRIGKLHCESTLVDISMNGAKIKHPKLTIKRRKLLIELGGRWCSAQIKWSNTLFAGLKFDRPLDKQTMSKVLNATQNTPETL